MPASCLVSTVDITRDRTAPFPEKEAILGWDPVGLRLEH